MAMLSAIATVLMFISFPVPFALPFYKIDISELPIMIGSFSISPVAGIIMEALKNLLHLTRSDTGGIGELANFISGSIFVFTAASIYKYKKSKMTAIIGLVIATILMGIASCFVNAYLTLPAFTGGNYDGLISMGAEKNGLVNNLYTFLVFSVLPFNLLKCTIVSVLTTALYKFISPLLKGNTSVRRENKVSPSVDKKNI